MKLTFKKALVFESSPENATEALDTIGSRAADKLKGSAQLPDGTQYPVDDLKDLMTLDLFCGDGEAPDYYTLLSGQHSRPREAVKRTSSSGVRSLLGARYGVEVAP